MENFSQRTLVLLLTIYIPTNVLLFNSDKLELNIGKMEVTFDENGKLKKSYVFHDEDDKSEALRNLFGSYDAKNKEKWNSKWAWKWNSQSKNSDKQYGKNGESTMNSADNSHEFEERKYPETQFACAAAKTDGQEMERGYRNLFRKLFEYIEGKNEAKKKIEMTTPVFMFTHMNEEKKPDKMSMCFWMPEKDASAPEANSEVFLWKMSSASFLVRRFSMVGEPSGNDWVKQMEILKKDVEDSDMTGRTDQNVCVAASYDPPWQQTGRRDEVLLRMKEEGEGEFSGPWGSI